MVKEIKITIQIIKLVIENINEILIGLFDNVIFNLPIYKEKKKLLLDNKKILDSLKSTLNTKKGMKRLNQEIQNDIKNLIKGCDISQ